MYLDDKNRIKYENGTKENIIRFIKILFFDKTWFASNFSLFN